MDHVRHCSQFRTYIYIEREREREGEREREREIGFVWQSLFPNIVGTFSLSVSFSIVNLTCPKSRHGMKAWNDELSVLLNEYGVESI